MLSDQDKRDLDWYYMNGNWQVEDLFSTVARIVEEHGGKAPKKLIKRGTCTCGEVDKENRLGHADDCKYFSNSVYEEIKPSPCEHGKRYCHECHGDGMGG